MSAEIDVENEGKRPEEDEACDETVESGLDIVPPWKDAVDSIVLDGVPDVVKG